MNLKMLFLTFTLSLTQIAMLEANEVGNNSNIDAINQAHAAAKLSTSNTQAMAGFESKDKDSQPFWSDQQKQQAKLESRYLKAIADDPDNKKNYAYLAGLYLTNNKTAKAIDAYQDAIIHDTDNPKLFAAISIAYLHQSKFDMAKAMADHALSLDPEMKQVEKINEYIVAKQEAIMAASKVPANTSADATSDKMEVGHGAVMPKASESRPNDAIHKPVK